MIPVKHPNVLNPWQVYRQSKVLLKHTSRASNADWYHEALELDRQWHIWTDGVEVVSSVFDKKSGQWSEGPRAVLPRDTGASVGSKKAMDKDAIRGLHATLDSAQLDAIFAHFEESDLRSLHESLAGLIRGKELGGKVKSLGVVLHVADEFAVADLAPEYSMDEDFEAGKQLLQLLPAEALGDSSVDVLAHSWRLLPYWGVEEGERRSVAVQVSRRFQPLFYELNRYSESRNVPVIGCLVAAPLGALRMTPFFLEPSEQRGQGNILVYHYRHFSTLAVLNQGGELLQIRSLQHRPGQDFPAQLGDILVNTAASVGLADPLVTIVGMCDVGEDALVAELSAFFANRAPMNIGLVTPKEVEGLTGIVGGRVEMAMGDSALLSQLEEQAVFTGTETFKELGGGWARQDFYGVTEEEKEIYPSQKDLKLLRFFGYAKVLVIAALVFTIGLTSWDYIRAMGTEYWKMGASQAQTATVTLEKLRGDRKRVDYWENVMARRSEGWLVMEVLLQLFEVNSGIIVTECSYSAEGETSSNKATDLAFSRSWQIEGYAKTEGGATLAKLSSNNYLKERFEELAADFDADSLMLHTDTRELEVSMQQRQGQMPASDRFPASVARHYRNSFDITINQKFTDKDPLALTMKPPVIASTQPPTP
ncbi:MAG: hypothetical protein KDN20_09405 [Verrucomicrobiae bacterium]|nr:hypothetical protein [Verrucomicrobiae bacterium]